MSHLSLQQSLLLSSAMAWARACRHWGRKGSRDHLTDSEPCATLLGSSAPLLVIVKTTRRCSRQGAHVADWPQAPQLRSKKEHHHAVRPHRWSITPHWSRSRKSRRKLGLVEASRLRVRSDPSKPSGSSRLVRDASCRATVAAQQCPWPPAFPSDRLSPTF